MATAKNNGSAAAKRRRIEEYERAPKHCASCDKPLSYDSRQNKYCSHSCAAQALNKQRAAYKACKHCGNQVPQRNTFCSRICAAEYKKRETLKHWLQTGSWVQSPKEFRVDENGHKMAVSDLYSTTASSAIRQHILEEQNHSCVICGNEFTWMGKELPTILDHIDGNAFDNRRENVRLICPNCNYQLPTSKGKNKLGRKARWDAAIPPTKK